VQRIKQEMETVGFDRVEIDPMGNVFGYHRQGEHLIAMDAHVDTVGVGNKDNWEHDPYTGYENDEIIFGRGTSDQEGGMASMVYAGKIIKDLGLEDDYTLLVTGTVQEEDCDGLCWQYIIEKAESGPNSSSPRNPPPWAFIAASGDAWRFWFPWTVSAPTVLLRKGATMPFSKWPPS
jgi:putative selenium metabolism hydrolase